MPDLSLPCEACAGTGWATHEDRHAETRPDVCTTCCGTGRVPSRTGEIRGGSFDPETRQAFGGPIHAGSDADTTVGSLTTKQCDRTLRISQRLYHFEDCKIVI